MNHSEDLKRFQTKIISTKSFFWYPKNKNFDSDDVDTEKPFFYKNFYGNLWPMNCDVWKKIILIGFSLSLDLDAIKNLTIEYFSKKFEVKIKGFRSECYNTEQEFLD
jgi:hypothetical protein